MQTDSKDLLKEFSHWTEFFLGNEGQTLLNVIIFSEYKFRVGPVQAWKYSSYFDFSRKIQGSEFILLNALECFNALLFLSLVEVAAETYGALDNFFYPS